MIPNTQLPEPLLKSQRRFVKLRQTQKEYERICIEEADLLKEQKYVQSRIVKAKEKPRVMGLWARPVSKEKLSELLDEAKILGSKLADNQPEKGKLETRLEDLKPYWTRAYRWKNTTSKEVEFRNLDKAGYDIVQTGAVLFWDRQTNEDITRKDGFKREASDLIEALRTQLEELHREKDRAQQAGNTKKLESLNKALTYPFVVSLETCIDPTSTIEQKEQLQTAITGFHWEFNREITALMDTCKQLDERLNLAKFKDFQDAAEMAKTFPEAMIEIFNKISKGDFELRQGDFVNSLVSLFQTILYRRKVDAIRKIHPTVPLTDSEIQPGDETNGEELVSEVKRIPIEEFTTQNAKALKGWLDKLCQSKEKNIAAVLNHAEFIGNEPSGSSAEKEYRNKKIIEQNEELDDTAYLNSLKLGVGNVVASLNQKFLEQQRPPNGLLFLFTGKDKKIFQKQKVKPWMQTLHLDRVERLEEWVLDFPPNYRSDETVQETLTNDEYTQYCLLEMLQNWNFTLFNIQNA